MKKPKQQLTMKQSRLMASLTQKEVAQEMSVHHHTYMKWEHNPGSMTIDNARMFANIVNRSFDEIFFEVESNLIRQKQKRSNTA